MMSEHAIHHLCQKPCLRDQKQPSQPGKRNRPGQFTPRGLGLPAQPPDQPAALWCRQGRSMRRHGCLSVIGCQRRDARAEHPDLISVVHDHDGDEPAHGQREGEQRHSRAGA